MGLDAKEEAKNIGLFVAAVAAMGWVAKKLKGTWLGLLFLKGE